MTFLYGQVDIDVKELLKQIADDNNVQIIEMESDKTISIYLNILHNTPFLMLLKRIYILNLNKYLWGGRLWNSRYLIATVSENTEEQIRNYIQNQKKK